MSESYNEKWRSFISKDEEAFDSSLLFEELEKEINKFDKLISEMSKIDLSTPDQTEDRSLLTEEKRILTFSDLPDIPISEIGWSSLSTTEEGKEIPSQQRQQLAQFLNNIQGNSLQEKLKSLSDFYKMDDTFKQKLSAASSSSKAISEAISYLTFFKTLTQVITNFNASTAGYTFESFLAVLLGGSQIATGGGTIADFKTGAGEPVSLKLYKEGNLEVAGSYTDLVNDLIRDGKMRYICVTKNLSGTPGAQEGNLNFYSFSFTLENLFNIFGNSKQIDSSACMLLPASFMATGGKNVDALSLTEKKQLPSTEEINKEYFGDDKKIQVKKSQEFYQKANDELKKKCLQVSFGYVSNKQFKLSERMIKDIVNLSQPTTKGVLPEGQSQVNIGSIEIGATKISEVLEQISKVLNENIFDIFNNLKALTINIQSYFAGGLQDDAKASAAQKNADNIEKKTGELKDKK